MVKRWKKGVIATKAYIYHEGHSRLIRFGADNCQELHVIIDESDRYSIPAAIRANWIEQDHPDVYVHIVPGDPATDDAAQWGWRTLYTLRADQERMGYDINGPDVVFSSEDYGEPYAKSMGAEHVMIDRYRSIVPCSGHEIRAGIMGRFQYLARPTKAHFTNRVIIVGAESTGKTTLAQALADKYQTVWVPEYGEMYWRGKTITFNRSLGKTWHTEEFRHIARMQSQMAYELSKDAYRITIEDTDEFATEIWHDRYVGYMEPSIRFSAMNRHNPKMYILTDINIPFVQNGWRDGENIRERMHDLFKTELIKRRYPYIQVHGTLQMRIDQASEAIDAMIAQPIILK